MPLTRPSQMPAERARMVRMLHDAARVGRGRASTLAQQLAHSDLYWVTRDMGLAALDASTDIPGWSLRDLPSRSGLMAVEPGALPPMNMRTGRAFGVRTPRWVDQVPATADVAMIEWVTVADALTVLVWVRLSTGSHAGSEYAIGWIVNASDAELADLDAITGLRVEARSVLALLGACVTMMAIPTVAELRQQTVILSRTKALGGAREAMVTSVTLRRLARRTQDTEPGDSGREYHHQWIVRGHWRQQQYGPAAALRRTTWVPSYLKGPEGAPLLPREHVYVWRR